MKNNRKPFSGRMLGISLFTVFTLLVTSCVYYNTFYNAEKYFESAQSYEVPETGRPPARAIQDYDEVIKRCGYILREHPNSRWADNALFLLGRSIYYKRRNIPRARDSFEELTRMFPNSKFVTESLIYIAKIDYELNNKGDAYRRLTGMINDEEYRDEHPRLLLLRSKWNLEDDNIQQAQADLQKIISDYRGSDKYEEAYLTLGTSFLEEEQYQEAKELFTSLKDARVSRRVRFNARYYLSLSLFFLQDYDTVLAKLNRLLRDEYEQKKFARLYLLQARTYAQQSRFEEAEKVFEQVIEENRRSSISAEASFYLANMYFFMLDDLENASTFYNRVSGESRNSPYVDDADAHKSIVDQLLLLRQDDLEPDQKIQTQFDLAENYLYLLNKPSSALTIYDEIRKQKDEFKVKNDSLEALIQELKSSSPLQPDSTVDEPANAQKHVTDDEMHLNGIAADEIDDITAEGIDEMDFFGINKPEEGDITYETKIDEETYAEKDTLETGQDIEKLKRYRDGIRDVLALYETNYIPHTLFLSAWVWMNEFDNHEKAEQIYDELKQYYPDNRYFYAVEQMLAGKIVSLYHPVETKIQSRYEEIMSIPETDTEKAIELLNDLLTEIIAELEKRPPNTLPMLEEYRKKTLFTIGYNYYFDIGDSTNAKNYFDTLLDDSPDSEYSRFVSNFYRDNAFVVIDSLTIEQEEPTTTTEEQDFPEETTEDERKDPQQKEHDENGVHPEGMPDDFDLNYTPLPGD